jgi:hypothetical protein
VAQNHPAAMLTSYEPTDGALVSPLGEGCDGCIGETHAVAAGIAGGKRVWTDETQIYGADAEHRDPGATPILRRRRMQS